MKRIAHILLTIALAAPFGISYAEDLQSYDLYNNDTINKIDLNNLKQGHWMYFGKDKRLPGYTADQLIEEGKFLNNRKTGIWKKYFVNGKMQNEITYQNSRPNGFAKIYYQNGNLKEEGIWKGNKWIGEYKFYHENGKIYHDFAYSEKGKRDGEQKYYYDSGQIMIEGNWEGGKEKGMIKEYYEDGNLRSEKFFNDGALDKTATITYEKEEKKVTAPKPEKKGTGVVVVKGEETRSIKMFNGAGYHKLYNKSRQLSKDGVFENHKLMSGKWYKYSTDGILENIEVYKNGNYVGDAPIEEQ